jgi:hypothetical protein
VLGSPNKSRHVIFEYLETGERVYLIFKREWFLTFQDRFAQFTQENPQYAEQGESINEESLLYAKEKGCEVIVFIHPEGFYKGYVNVLLNFCKKHNLIYTQDRTNSYKVEGGTREAINETTYSFPRSLLTRVEI